MAAGSSASDLACLWDLATGALIRAIRAHPEGLSTVAFAADSFRLLTAGPDGTDLVEATMEAPGFFQEEGNVEVAAQMLSYLDDDAAAGQRLPRLRRDAATS